MSEGVTTIFEYTRVPVMISVAVSVLLHVIGVLIMVLWIGGSAGGGGMESSLQSQPPLMVPEDEPLQLGLNESQAASIDWLGIDQPDAVQGEAEISETNQAAQTLAVGNAEQSVPEEFFSEQQQDPAEPEPEPQPVDKSDSQAQVEQTIDSAELIEPAAPIPSELETQPSPDGIVPEQIESTTNPNASPSLQPKPLQEVLQESAPEDEQLQEAAESNIKSNPAQHSEVKAIGSEGILSDREVAATRIKNALDYDPRKPNIPVAGKGLEIKTVRPRYTTAVRLSALPNNPIVLIYFNAMGKVAKAEFLKERSVVYSTGIRGVDEPLLSAIYQWRAKGVEIDQLDPADPKSLLEVSIKIVFRPERSIVP